MKKLSQLARLLPAVLCVIALSANLYAQDMYSTVQSGPWNSTDTWENGNIPDYTVNNYNRIYINHEVDVDGSNILIRKGEIKIFEGGILNLSNGNLSTKPNGRFFIDGGKAYVYDGTLLNEGKNNFGGVFVTNAYLEVFGDYLNNAGGEMHFDSACVRITNGTFTNSDGCPMYGTGNVEVVVGVLSNFGTWSAGIDYCANPPIVGEFPIEPNCEEVSQTCDCIESPCNPDIIQGTFASGEIISAGLDALARGEVNENLLDDLFILNSDTTRVLIDVVWREGVTGAYDKMVDILVNDYGEPMNTWVYNGGADTTTAPSTYVTLYFDISKVISLDTTPYNQQYILEVRQTPVGIFSSCNLVTGSSLDNQGDFAQTSYLLRLGYGLSGEDIKVGILSDSYDKFSDAATDVASCYLPGAGNTNNLKPVNVLADLTTNSLSGADEGRAMAHIVHSVAPKAELYFHTAFQGPGAMAEAINELAANSVKVMTDDITHPTQPFFGPGLVSQAIDNVTSGGVAYFTSAGNFASRAYYKQFTPASNGCHQYSTGDTLQEVQLDSGEYLMVLQWDEPFASIANNGGATTDLDVIFANEFGQDIYIFSEKNIGKDPVEIIPFFVKKATTTYVKIKQVAGSVPTGLDMKYIVYKAGATGDGFQPQEGTGEWNAGTITGHAAAPSAFTLAATRWSETPTYGKSPSIESFSSRGDATTPGKPDASAVQGANVGFAFGVPPSQYNDGDALYNFFGTSASAPHAAALAALLYQAQDTFDINTYIPSFEVLQALRDNAIPVPGATPEDAGAGFLSGYEILSEYANPAPNIDFVTLDSLTDYANDGGVVVINGSFFVPGTTQIFFRGEEITDTTVTDSSIIVQIPPYLIGDPTLVVVNSSNLNGDGGSDTTDLLDIGFRQVTVASVDTFKYYGEALPDFRYVAYYIEDVDSDGTNDTVYLSSDEYALLDPYVSFTCAADEFTNAVGTIPTINVNIDTENENFPVGLEELYEFNPSPGNLTINPVLLIIEPAGFSATYGDPIYDLVKNYTYTIGDEDANIADDVKATLINDINAAYLGVQSSIDTNYIGIITNYSSSEFLSLSNFQTSTSLGGLSLSNAGGVAGVSSSGSVGGLSLSNTLGGTSLGGLSLSNTAVPTGALAIDAQLFWDTEADTAVDLSGGPRPAWGTFEVPSIANAFSSLSSSPGGLSLSNMDAMIGAASATTSVGGLSLSNATLGASPGGLSLSNTLSFGSSLGGLSLSNDLNQGLGGLSLSNTAFSGFLSLSNASAGGSLGGLSLSNSQTIAIISVQDSLATDQEFSLFPINIITGVNVGLQNIIPALYIADNSEYPYSNSRNYIVKYAYGEGDITKAPLSIEMTSDTIYYGDVTTVADPSPSNVQITAGELKYEDDIFGNVLDSIKIVDINGELWDGSAGTYYVVPELITADTNYNLTVLLGTLLVQQRPVTVTVANDTVVYGNMAVATEFTASVSNLASATDVVYSELITDYNAGDIVGTYNIYPVLTDNPNYAVSIDTGVLVVTKRAVTVTVATDTVIYGDIAVASEFTATVANLASSSDVVYSELITDYNVGDAVGTYDIYPVLTDNQNYAVTIDTGDLVVTKRLATITVDDATVIFGEDVDPSTFSATEENVLDGDIVYTELATDYVPGDLGDYDIYPVLTGNANYNVSVDTGTLSVTPFTVTINPLADTVPTCNPVVDSSSYEVVPSTISIADVFPSGADAVFAYSLVESPPKGVYPDSITVETLESPNPGYIVIIGDNADLTVVPAGELPQSGCSDELKESNTTDPRQGDLTQDAYNPNEEPGDVDIKAYPNPFSGELTIDVLGYTGEPVNLQVLNMVGQLVKSAKVDLKGTGRITLELSDLASGVYFVRLKGDHLDQTLKLIKQ